MSKGICFIKPLFNKVVAGEKIQTRRIITPQPDYFLNGQPYSDIRELAIKSKYNVGETVYLKEPYAETCDEYGTPIIAYKFGGKPRLKLPDSLGCEIDTNWCIDNYPACGKWKNKLFMPESVARHFIEITAERAERLQDISEEDCLKEGIIRQQIIRLDQVWYQNGLSGNGLIGWPTAQQAYAALIDQINGKGTFQRNPFVWVYDFRLVK